MYRVPLFPGVPTEWRHTSTSHAISWSPEKHLAGLGAVIEHQHRFDDRGTRIRTCRVAGCDSQLLQRPKPTADEAKTGREAKEQESRLRGNKAAQQRRKSIPF